MSIHDIELSQQAKVDRQHFSYLRVQVLKQEDDWV